MALIRVAQQGGALELQFFGGFKHFFFQILHQLFGVPLQKRHALAHERRVFLRRNAARARCETAPQMTVQAWPVFADVARGTPGGRFSA